MIKIGIIPNNFIDSVVDCTAQVIKFLCKNDCEIYIPDVFTDTLEGYEKECVQKINQQDIFCVSDIIISIGGDGTILEIAENAARKSVPILGINMGTVGFMTELEATEVNLLEAIFTSGYKIQPRMMLDVEIIRDNKVLNSYIALNDVVMFKGIISKLIEINLFCNDKKVTSYRADGLIVATPTGSTAYTLSAGGAVIDPQVDGICVTPVNANAFLNSFPMVYSAKNEFSLEVARKRDDQVYLSVDGMKNIRILYGDRVVIRKSETFAELVRIKNTEFYEAVCKKLSERGK